MIARALLASFWLALLGVALPAWSQRGPAPQDSIGTITLAELPDEARRTLALIEKGGPFPYAKDGAVFGNREARLPRAKRGYYREYTVKTPGERSRGARRIIAGREGEHYYSSDHYKTFRRIRD